MNNPRWTEYQPLAALVPALRNPKRHDLAALRRMMDRFGYTQPVLVDERTGRLVSGHGRLKLLRELQLSGQEPPAGLVRDGNDWLVPVTRGWSSNSDAEADAYLAADNQATIMAGWDSAELAELLGPLDADLLEATGFTNADLAGLLAGIAGKPEARTDPDDVPEPGPSVSRLGDLWELGPHRLVVGDSTDVGTFSRLMSGGLADMVWTDPPYGVAYAGKTVDALTIQNDALEGDALRQFLVRALTAVVGVCRPGGCWYVAAPAKPLHLQFALALADVGVWRQTLVWVKDQFVMGRSDFHYRHEPIFYGWKPGAAHHEPPERTHDTVWEVPRPRRSAEHPTMKPVELIARALELSSDLGETVLDPFAGSGSTLIAAYQTRRVARLVELDPRYADVICRRWQQHTGDVPVRDGRPVDFDAAATASTAG